jgi:Fur family ferric uptake transcriptional regulator
LGEATGPVSHGDLVETLMSAGFDRATLYRNLMDLTEAGLVTRSDLGDHVWRFELRSSGNDHAVEHPHFVCVECGSVSCLPGVNVRVRTTPEAPRSLTRRGFEVQLKGRCDACDTAAP